jgi:hypothetical protein
LRFGSGEAIGQNRNVLFTSGVSSAGELFTSLFAYLQIVRDVVAVRMIAENQAIWWMFKAKIFHGVLQSVLIRVLL